VDRRRAHREQFLRQVYPATAESPHSMAIPEFRVVVARRRSGCPKSPQGPPSTTNPTAHKIQWTSSYPSSHRGRAWTGCPRSLRQLSSRQLPRSVRCRTYR